MQDRTDIIIAGSGLNGASFALAIAQAGFRVTIVDPMPPATRIDDDFDGRGYALALTSQRLFKAIGIWDAVANHAQPILKIKVSDGHAGEGASPLALEFDHAEIEEGPMGYMIEDRYIRQELQRAIENDDKITLINGESVTDHNVTTSGVGVTLSSGRTIGASLLVGSDGRKSPTAKRTGIKKTGWDYGQTALVCAIEHEKAHDGTAHQFFMPPGPLAILPLPGNQSSIVWTETHDRAAEITAMDDADYLDVLRPRFGDFLGKISLAGQRFAYPLNLIVADKFYSDRIALIGDAAHGVHPIAGQGLNAGLKDVGALAEVLALARRRGEDIGKASVLQRYERWRRFDVMTLAASTDSINRLFSNDNQSLRITRDLGLGLVNAMPGLKRLFIREAAGLTGELPRLLQGRPI